MDPNESGRRNNFSPKLIALDFIIATGILMGINAISEQPSIPVNSQLGTGSTPSIVQSPEVQTGIEKFPTLEAFMAKGFNLKEKEGTIVEFQLEKDVDIKTYLSSIQTTVNKEGYIPVLGIYKDNNQQNKPIPMAIRRDVPPEDPLNDLLTALVKNPTLHAGSTVRFRAVGFQLPSTFSGALPQTYKVWQIEDIKPLPGKDRTA